MFPPGQMTAVPPLPPQIRAQQQQQNAGPMFAKMGAQLPDPVALMEAQVAKLEQWAQETAPIASQVGPQIATLLVPIAQAGKAMQSEVEAIKQQNAGPSPMVTGSVPPNLPGNIPGARPA